MATIRERGIPTVQDNYDRGVGNSNDGCGCAYRTVEAKALGNLRLLKLAIDTHANL